MYKEKKVAAIIVAAGTSERMGFDKLFAEINGKPVIWHTVSVFLSLEIIDEVIIVAGNNIYKMKELFSGIGKVIHIVPGGRDRYISAKNGVNATEADLIAIHDGARPFVKKEVIESVIKCAYETDAAAPAVPVKDTIKLAESEIVISTPDRNKLFAVQTPQVFSRELYQKAWNYVQDKVAITDDCMLVEKFGKQVFLTKGDYENIKITTKDDLTLQKNIIRGKNMRIGHGYDVHKFAESRKLILGGVEIPYIRGLDGHSDADVLLHAISDALLGALAIGDIGKFFPDDDPKYKDADSLVLLEAVYSKVQELGYIFGNIDATIICEKPKLALYITDMRNTIANALKVPAERISIKATTEEGLGFTGEEEGIAAHCICLITEV